MGLKVVLEGSSSIGIVKGDGRPYAPRPKFRGVRNLPCIVASQTVLKVVGCSRIVSIRVYFALQDIDIRETLHGLPGRSSERMG